ncbi:MAG: DUF3450 family protein [Candidatus Latescibacteria bacterium]|nr:DUF3450 family protein [bacterium]MBD3423302.1 DUF3450 family protein [Candidatus Latescibacterota bacterium]
MNLKTAMVFIILLLMLIPVVSPGQDEPEGEELVKVVDSTIGIQQETQQKREEWAEEKSELEARYRTAKANIDYLTRKKESVQKKHDALMERNNELERRLDESDRLQNSLQDTLNIVLARLESWVDRDLPFLLEERKARIEMLKKEIAKPDILGAEKLRKLLEALQIEANYGGNVEVYQQKVTVGGDTLFVDVLHIGRVSVFWRTPDGQQVGSYDPASEAWVELPDKYNRPVSEAMEMASRIRPVELIELPLGRINNE